jgi:hypothetical protein
MRGLRAHVCVCVCVCTRMRVCLMMGVPSASWGMCVSLVSMCTRQVICVTVGVSLVSWVVTYVAVLLLAPSIAFTAALSRAQVQGIASLAATLSMARSPASAVRCLSAAFCH